MVHHSGAIDYFLFIFLVCYLLTWSIACLEAAQPPPPPLLGEHWIWSGSFPPTWQLISKELEGLPEGKGCLFAAVQLNLLAHPTTWISDTSSSTGGGRHHLSCLPKAKGKWTYEKRGKIRSARKWMKSPAAKPKKPSVCGDGLHLWRSLQSLSQNHKWQKKWQIHNRIWAEAPRETKTLCQSLPLLSFPLTSQFCERHGF